MYKKPILLIYIVFVLSLVGSVSVASAETIAYWRFDDVGDADIEQWGPIAAGNPLPDSDGQTVWRKAVHDHSGNGNHLTTWDYAWAGFEWSSDVPEATVPLTGASNALSMVHTEAMGCCPSMMTWSEQSSPSGTDIEGITPAAFTIEASFKMDVLGGYHTIVGRDGMNIATSNAALAPLYFQVRPNNVVAIIFVDVAGFDHLAESSMNAVTTGQWYNMVAVSDGSTLSLYLDNELVAQTNLTLSGSTNTALAIGNGSGGDWEAGTWSVSRGLYDGGHVDRVYGYVDEVRISNTALTISEFLFAPVKASNPNPAHLDIDVPIETNLTWKRGIGATRDEVYFGTDPCALPLVDTITVPATPQYDPPGDLIPSMTYYWQIIEVNDTDPCSPYPGPIWSFSTVSGEAGNIFPLDGSVTPGTVYTPTGNIYTFLDASPGVTAVSHVAYFSHIEAEVAGRVEDANLGPQISSVPNLRWIVGLPDSVHPGDHYPDGLVRGTKYYWAVDATDAMGNKFSGDVWDFGIQGYKAFAPNPPNEALLVDKNVLLSWSPGLDVQEHDVYIGTSYYDVNIADEFDTTGIYKGPWSNPQYQCSGLPGGTKFYWRIDEVNGRFMPGTGTIYKGDVWTFTTIDIPGLVGEYYHHTGGASPAGFESRVLVRIDPGVNFDFDTNPPPGVRADDFSVRWTGRMVVPVKGETYTFTTETDDGARLWVDGQLIIDQWIDQGPTAVSGSIHLDEFGPYDIKMEYYQNGGGAVARLYWQSPSTPYQIIPEGNLEASSDEAKAALGGSYGPYPPDLGLMLPNEDLEFKYTLSWGSGIYTAAHELYFSTSFDDVNERTAPRIVLSDPCYTPPGLLDMDQTYYWCVDEVNSLGPAPGQWPGDIWSFTPVSTGYVVREWWLGIPDIILDNLKNDPRYPNEPDGSELLTTMEGPTGWADNYGSRIHGWLRPRISGEYRFWIATDDNGELWLSTDEDPANATLISSVSPAWADPRQWYDADVTPSNPIHLEGGGKYYISALMKEGGGGDNIAVAWQGPAQPEAPIAGDDNAIIDGRFLSATPYDPPYATSPSPPDGAPSVDDRSPLLSWYPGSYTQAINGHRLYFSSDYDDVNNRTVSPIILTEPNYPHPGVLDLGRTYYWLVDEVNSLGPAPGLWQGRVWRFTMSECMSLDNMEDYNDRKEIRRVWRDGYADVVWGGTYPYLTLIQGGSSGSNLNVSSAVGAPADGATGPVYGGIQAMVLRYDNDGFTYSGLPGDEKWEYDAPYYSEIEANTVGTNSLNAGVNWSGEGVKALSLWFQGHPPSLGGHDSTGWPTYKMRSRGRDIQGRHDEFYYLALYPFTTSGYVYVQVLDIENTDPLAKAGVMIREKWTPYSKYAAVFMTPGNGVTFQWRATEDGPTSYVTKPGVTVPQWVKLERTGSGNFTAKHSVNGTSWQDVNAPDEAPVSPLIPMGIDDPNLYIGTAVTSHDALETCTADLNDVRTNPSLNPPWHYGDIGNNDAEQLYAALSDGIVTAVVEHDDVNAATVTDWQEWNVELSKFSDQGLNLSNVRKVYVGLGDRSSPVQGGSGALYIDDIRACPPRCVPSIVKPEADIAIPYDCIADEKDLRVLAGDWLMKDYVADPLLGWYRFEGDGTDSSIYGHDANVIGDPNYVVAGRIGQSIQLDGTDDYLIVGSVGISGDSARTIAGWAKADVPSSDIADWTNVFGFTSLTSGQNGRSFDIQIVGTTTTPGSTTSGYFGIHVYGWEYDIMANDQDWHHLAGTYDGATIRWYGDGIELGSADRQLNTVDNVQMGKRGDNANYFPGQLDDVRVYDKSLTMSEIQSIMNGGLGTVTDHHPIFSPADLYQNEPQGSQWINFKDYGVLANQYLDEVLWP